MATVALDELASLESFESDRLFEIFNGERREKRPMSALAVMIASVLARRLGVFAEQHKLGVVVVEMLFRLRPDRPQRRPDVAFVGFERWSESAAPADDQAAWDVVPHFAVEVISPTNTAYEVMEKIREYFEAGVQLVWVIYPLQRCVQVFESSKNSRILREGEELDGGTVLPGLRLNVSELFAAAAKPQ